MGHHPEICDSAGNAPPETLAFASSERPIALQAGLSPPTLACKTEPLKLETEHSLQRRSGTSPPASIPSRPKIIVILILALDAMALHQGGYFMATAPPRQRLECGDFSTAPLRAHVSANLLAWRADKRGGERAALHKPPLCRRHPDALLLRNTLCKYLFLQHVTFVAKAPKMRVASPLASLSPQRGEGLRVRGGHIQSCLPSVSSCISTTRRPS